MAAGRAQPMLVRRGHVLYPERLSDHLDTGGRVRPNRTRGFGLFLSRPRFASAARVLHGAAAGFVRIVCVGKSSGRGVLRPGQNMAVAADLYVESMDCRDRDMAAGTEPFLVAVRRRTFLPVMVAGVSPMGYGARLAHRPGGHCRGAVLPHRMVSLHELEPSGVALASVLLQDPLRDRYADRRDSDRMRAGAADARAAAGGILASAALDALAPGAGVGGCHRLYRLDDGASMASDHVRLHRNGFGVGRAADGNLSATAMPNRAHPGDPSAGGNRPDLLWHLPVSCAAVGGVGGALWFLRQLCAVQPLCRNAGRPDPELDHRCRNPLPSGRAAIPRHAQTAVIPRPPRPSKRASVNRLVA